MCLSVILMSALLALSVHEDGADEDSKGAFRETSVPIWDHREVGVGDLIPDVEFKTIEGQAGSLAELLAEGPVVLVMRDPDCPLGKRYGPTLAALQERYDPAVVRFAWLVVGEGFDSEDAARGTHDIGLTGPVLLDPNGDVAAQLEIATTTEALLIDQGRTLRYRGAVDDQYGIGFAKDAPQHTWLADVLDAWSAGREPIVRSTSAPGCVLDLPATPTDDSPPTWHGQVSRVVQDKCMSCHRDGGVAPFALETYEQARRKRGMIGMVVEEDIMPPWGAVPSDHAWRNDRSLAAKDRALIEAWLAADCPEGDETDTPAPRSWRDGWAIGEPDLIVEGPAIDVPASGTVGYQYFYVHTGLERDRWISALEVMPGAQEVVHHVLVFVEAPTAGYDGRVLQQGRGGTHGYFAGYIPGQGARDFGSGRAKLLPANSWLKFQVHYTTNGTAVTDATRLGFVFTDEEPREIVKTSGIANQRLLIEPGDANYSISAEGEFGSAAVLSGFSPHMHLRGKAFKYVLEYPDGEQDTLLDIPAYDFNWQTMYELAEPLQVPSGTKLKVTAWYDNSADNPANPDPTATVRFGEQTWDEMMIAYFEWWRPAS